MFGSSLALHASIAAASLSAHTPVKGGLVVVVCVAVVSVVVVSVRVVVDVTVVGGARSQYVQSLLSSAQMHHGS